MPPPASSARCKCCAGSDLEAQATVVSPFVAFKAWGGRLEPISLLSCKDCGFKFYGRSLSDHEVRAFYDGYRDESYYGMRNRFEPFYDLAPVFRIP